VASHARFGMECRRVACGPCGLVQRDPLPLRAKLEAYYRSHEYRRDHGKVCIGIGNDAIAPDDPRWPAAFASMGFWRRTRAIEMSGVTEGAVLDVGCGPGHVLDGYTELGWETHGLELDEEEAAKAVDKGHAVFIGPLDDFDPPRTFDLIVSHHVLEHLYDPIDALERMRSMLAEGVRTGISISSASM